MADSFHRLKEALADRYRLERALGAGGMATVYLANDVRHNRTVAIKVMHPELAALIGAARFLKGDRDHRQASASHRRERLDPGPWRGMAGDAPAGVCPGRRRVRHRARVTEVTGTSPMTAHVAARPSAPAIAGGVPCTTATAFTRSPPSRSFR